MNRIDATFRDLRGRNARALMPYITAGDPDIEGTAALIQAMEKAGASVVEIGVPFSDPIADGPVIQASMTHALSQGLKTRDVLAMVARVRPTVRLGLVLMVSYSIVHKLGPDTFMRDAAAAGVDGLILPDLPVQESDEAAASAKKHGLILSMLISPTTPTERAVRIAQASTGFVYLLARAGITGERSELPPDLADRIGRIRQVTPLPIAVGFGVSSADQVRQVVQVADAAIVGSAIMRRVAPLRGQSHEQVAAQIGGFVSGLAAGLSG